MESFKTFLREGTTLVKAQTMAASGTNANRHVDKYMNDDKLSNTKYTLAKAHGSLPADSKVSVSHVIKKDDKYHAVVKDGKEEHHIPVSKLYKPHGENMKNPLAKEDMHFNHLKGQIDKAVKDSPEGHIKFEHNGKVHHITGVKSVPGTVKADFALTDKNGNDVHHISHKDSANAGSGSHGYGGLGHSYGSKTIKDVVSKIKKTFPNGIKGAATYHLDPENNEEHKGIVQKSMYGPEHGGHSSPQNVDTIHHGKMSLVKNAKGNYEIHSDKVLKNGDLPKEKIGIYARAASAYGSGSLGLPGTRLQLSHKKAPIHL